jgi:hypothetical protein
LTYHGTPTLNLSSLGIGRSDPVLVNNGAVDDTALLVAYEYFDILSITLPLFYKSERAFAELMDGLIEIRRADRSDGVSAYPTGNQDLALRTSFIELAAKLAGIRPRLCMLRQRLRPSFLAADASLGTISLFQCAIWADDAIHTLVKELTHRPEVPDDIEEEIEVICRIRVETARTFREMSALLSQAMDNGIDYTDLLNSPPAWAPAAD